ncbi:MAG: hypothetical protein ACREC8_02020 [Limisphaerales bacterium]
METKPHAKANATDGRTENLTCWHTATSPQCLRVETTSEIHLFPYGYFQHAKFSRQGNKDIVEILFQDTTVIARGKNLELLCDALARLSVERIKTCPDNYGINVKEGVIADIEIKKNGRQETNSER